MKTSVKIGVIICISLFLFPFLAYAIDNKLDVKLYVNDKETSFSVYENDTGYEGYYLESFIPLNSVLDTLGFDVSQTANSITIISEEEKVFVKFEFLDDYFKYDKYPSSEFKKSYNGYSDTYIEIDGIYYIGLDRLATILHGEAVQQGDSIYLYTQKYYSDNVAISVNIGHLEDIAVYVNEVPIEANVYYNRTIPEVSGPDNVSDFVELEPILKCLSATLNTEMQNEILNSEEIVYINNERYIPLSQIRYLIDGSLRQDDYSNMYLYTADFVRTDIPATLEECYAALDSLLDDASKEAIKVSSNDDLIDYHFGLGLWIRNNWIYPAEDRIAKVFLENGIGHPDDMSQFIIEGYHYYLNNEEYPIETYTGEIQKEKTNEHIINLVSFFVFILTISVVRFFFRKLPYSMNLLEKAACFHFAESLTALCIFILFVIRVELFVDTNSWNTTTYSVGLVNALILSFIFIVAVVKLLCILLQRSDGISVKKKQIIIQIISIAFISIFLAYYIEYVSSYNDFKYYNINNFTFTYKQNFYREIASYAILAIIITLISKLLLNKLPHPVWLPDRTAFPKLFRVLLVLCAMTLFSRGMDLVFSGRWTYVTELIWIILFALCVAFTALFCFVDMTRKQIAVSAVLPTICLLAYGIESEFFSYGIGYGVFGFPHGDICLWDYIFPMDYIFFFSGTIGSYWPTFLNIVFAFFPFVYVLLARCKSLRNTEEIEAV